MSAYSHLKALRHPDVLESIKTGVPARLPHVQLILSDLCQQACKFCAYRLDGYAPNQLFDERRMMSTEKALEIVEDCAEIGVQAVQFTGGGEPTLHKDFAQVLVNALDLGMKCGLVSNGVKITPNLAQIITKGAWVRISLDAATEETYVKIRRVHPNQFRQAQNAIRNLKIARDAYGGNCVIGVGFVVTPDNWREVLEAAKLAKELGADNFRISAMFSQFGERVFSEFEAQASALCHEAEGLSDAGFKVFNRFDDRVSDLHNGSPDESLCGYQFFTTYIGADLNVYRCCGYAYNERGLIGSIKDQRFKDFWLSQERFDNQVSFDARGCERCQFRAQNSALAYALSKEPQMHEEFV